MQKLFGTDGIRGPVGTSPLTTPEIIKLGSAIGRWIHKTYGSHAQILLAQDTRASGHWITATLSAGLLLSRVTVHHAGILPTPAVSRLIADDLQFSVGIIISASHNVYQDNGIKLVDRRGNKLTQQAENEITTLYHNDFTQLSQTFGAFKSFTHAAERYQQSVLTFFSTLNLSNRTLVLDCAHGATYQIAPEIFRQLGASIIELNTQPSGSNINEQCGSVYPEKLQRVVREHNADMGIAFDGDGDRAIIVNRAGAIKNGDDILALLSHHPAYQNQSTVAGTIMSNQGLARYLEQFQKTLARTAVGDRWVSEYLIQHQLLLGGEQSGHIILKDYLATGDGIVTALRLLEAIQHTDNWDLKTFKPCPQLLVNVPVRHKKDLKQSPLAAIITEYEHKLESGRVSVRYSGTENLLRIMVEAEQLETVRSISAQLSQRLKKELQ